MKELKVYFQDIGFSNVKTLLATGNVLFEGEESNLPLIESSMKQKFGFSVEIIIHPFTVIREIIDSNPFKDIEITPKTKLYVSFYKESKDSVLTLPFSTDDNAFSIIRKDQIAIFSVVDLEKTGTVEGMKILEKEYGKKLTTRNYNTIVKLANL